MIIENKQYSEILKTSQDLDELIVQYMSKSVMSDLMISNSEKVRGKMKKIKMTIGIDKSKLIKCNKRLVACGKNF